jgi:hypothetical protein
MSNQPLRKIFSYLNRAVHTDDGWIHPLRDVVSDVTATEAAWKPSPEVASIWEVVAHTTPYLYDVLSAFRGTERVKHEDWHDVSDTSEKAWKALQSNLLAGIDQLGAEVEKFSEADFTATPPRKDTERWEYLVDISVHNAYHAGQIVKVRQLYAARPAGKKEAAAV